MGCVPSREALVDHVALKGPPAPDAKRAIKPTRRRRWSRKKKKQRSMSTDDDNLFVKATDPTCLTLRLCEEDGVKSLGYSCNPCDVDFIPLRQRDEHLVSQDHQARWKSASLAAFQNRNEAPQSLFRGVFRQVSSDDNTTDTTPEMSSSSAGSEEEVEHPRDVVSKECAVIRDSPANADSTQLVVYQPPINDDKYICPVIKMVGPRGFKCTLCDVPFFADKALHQASVFHMWALRRVAQAAVDDSQDVTQQHMAKYFVNGSTDHWNCSLCHDLGVEKSLSLAMERRHVYGRLHYELSDMFEVPSIGAQLEWNTQNPHKYVFFTETAERAPCRYAVCTLCEMRLAPSFQSIAAHVHGRIHQALLTSYSDESELYCQSVGLSVATHGDVDTLDSLVTSPMSGLFTDDVSPKLSMGIIDKRCQFHRAEVRDALELILQQRRAKACLEALSFFSAYLF